MSTRSPQPGIGQEVAAISCLKLPFYLKGHQLQAVDAWMSSGMRGSIIYSSGTGKTEIAFECARRAAAAVFTKNNPKAGGESITCRKFDILFIVPRIVLINQNFKRLIDYKIPKEKIGVYFGEKKEVNKEIIISTYQSVLYSPALIRRSKMVVFDEVHLVSDTARVLSRIFDVVVEDHTKALLGLTATINVNDPKFNTIATVLPPIKKYMLKEAVEDGRLTKPVVIPIKVKLTTKEQQLYNNHSNKIRNISARFKRYDANSMSMLLKKGGFAAGMAKAWFSNIRKRKLLLSCADTKLSAVVDLIVDKHPNQKVMVFSETLDSINKLKTMLELRSIRSAIVDSKIDSVNRQKILSRWGSDFYVLLSIHTLEIGYDVPEVGIEIILASTSNMNQIIQRIGRIVRKYEGKKKALIYVIHVSETKDDDILDLIRKAVEMGKRTNLTAAAPSPGRKEKKRLSVFDDADTSSKESREEQLRIKRAYNILESNAYEPMIVMEQEQKQQQHAIYNQKLFHLRSSKEKDKFYQVNAEIKTCSCPDFKFNNSRCKHIIASELIYDHKL
ncbi:MAG: helicase-related protein [Nitrososphaeraceae archaeon]